MIEFSTDNLPYEKVGKNEPVCIVDQIPFEIPESWEWVRLTTLGEIVGGGTPKTNIPEYWDKGNIPWLTPADMKFVTGKYVDKGERCITEEGLKGSSAHMMPAGTIVYSSRAPIGYIAIASTELCTNQGFKSLVPVLTCIDDYVYYCLIAFTPEIQSRASGTTFKEISGTEFGKTLIPLPPLAEQQRIVKRIEDVLPALKMYDTKETALRKMNGDFPDQLRKSILQWAVQGKLVHQDPTDEPASILLERIRAEKQQLVKEGKIKKDKHESVIFRRDNSHYEKVGLEETCIDNELPFDIPDTWSWVRFSDIAIFENGDRSNKYPVEADYVSDGIPFFGAKDMGDKYMEFSTVRFITQEKFAQLGNGKLQNGDLVCLLRGSVGKTRIFKESEKYSTGFICAQMMIIRCLDLNILDYLYALINSPYYCKAIESKITGTAVRQLPAREVANILIPLPPLNEQFRIIEKLSEIFFDLQTL